MPCLRESLSSFDVCAHFLEMGVDLGGELLHLVHDLWERGGVAVGELADAADEGLGNAVEFALDGLTQSGEPFVIHDEGLDLGLAELRVFLVG